MPEAVIIKRMMLTLQKQGQHQEAYCIKATPDTVGFMGVQCPRKPVFLLPLTLKVFGSFGMAACRKWNRNLRNVGVSRTDRGYRAI